MRAPEPIDHALDDEANAVRVALTGTLLARAGVAARALARLLRDPEDTRQVFALYVALNASAFPAILARFRADPEGARLLAERPAIDSRSVDLAALAAQPAHTLGGAFARHLNARGLDPDIFQPPPGAPPDAAYLAQRLRQSHDLWHVVTGYDTDIAGELALQAFTYAQIRAPGPAVLSVAGALRWGAGDPRVLRLVLEGFRRGRAARSLLTVPWERKWSVSLADLRAELRVPPRAP